MGKKLDARSKSVKDVWSKDKRRPRGEHSRAMTTADPASLVTIRVGERLRKLRNAREIPLERLGAELGVNWHRLAKYEKGRGEAPYWLLIRLAEYFGVSVEFLLLGPAESAAQRPPATSRFRKAK